MNQENTAFLLPHCLKAWPEREGRAACGECLNQIWRADTADGKAIRRKLKAGPGALQE